MNFNRVLGARVEHNLLKKQQLNDPNYTMSDADLKVIITQQEEAFELILEESENNG